MLTRLSLLAASAGVLVSAQFGGPPAVAPTCTGNSFQLPSWYIRDLKLGNVGSASFSVLNRATDYKADLACVVREGSWSTCSIAAEATSVPAPIRGRGVGLRTRATSANEVLVTKLLVNGTFATVQVTQSWMCSDRKGPPGR